MKALLARLNSADVANGFAERARGLPEHTPVSLSLPLAHATINWLDALPAEGPWWAWARPQRGQFCLGVGHAFHWSSAGAQRFAALDHAYAGLSRHWPGREDARAFLGFAFSPSASGPLPNALLAVPALLLHFDSRGCRAVLTAPAGALPDTLAVIRSALGHPASQAKAGKLTASDETLTNQAWTARVGAVLREIGKDHLAKVVLTRRRSLQAQRPVSAATLLDRLAAAQPNSVVYGHGDGNLAFVGATPERLIRLRGHEASADALAGTAWPGSQSLDAGKNRHEQSLVVEAVIAALANHSQQPPGVAVPSLHPAGRISHLRSKITATVRPGTSLFDLIESLHPTPAVGGWPTAPALTWLQAHGEIRSAWYSGGIGWLDAEGNGEISVALRSALIQGQAIELQAGAGIVSGSDAQLELAETEAKFGTLLDALSLLANLATGTHGK